MQLGALLARFDDEAVVLETLLSMGDLVLMSRVQAAAEGAGTDVAAWAHEAVGQFVTSANDESWMGLMSACSNAADPGLAALRRMIETALHAKEHVCR